MSFQINKYQVIKKAVPYELANFIFNYFFIHLFNLISGAFCYPVPRFCFLESTNAI